MAKLDQSYVVRQINTFERRFNDWLITKGALTEAMQQEGEIEGHQPDHPLTRKVAELDDALDACRQLVMTTHAPQPWMIARKFLLIEEMILEGHQSVTAGEPIAWMIACVKADVMSLPMTAGTDAD